MASNDQQPSQGNHQPNVRHIPIFVEGRDQPIVNKETENAQKSSSGGKMPTVRKVDWIHKCARWLLSLT
jgi:hypothetical protein